MGDEYASMKRRVARWAVEQVDDGMVVGLGTGSTTAFAIDELGKRVDAGLAIEGIPTSHASRDRAIDAGITMTSLDEVTTVDVAIDGADQVCDTVLLKGGGGAHTRERVIDASADRFIVVVDERKVSTKLDGHVALEVLPEAIPSVLSGIDTLGGKSTIRTSTTTDGPAYTERGNLLVDADFGVIERPETLANELWATPGVLDHGLFIGVADVIAIGKADGVELLE